jgi:GcrA cell cycle regulator
MAEVWTPERSETAMKLWARGFSAQQIAAQLRGVTRSAVLGRLHRMRAPKRKKPGGETAQRNRIRARIKCMKVTAPKTKPVLPPERPEPIAPLNISILEITHGQCRAVTDNSDWGRARMCGHPTALGSVYCPGHALRYSAKGERSL